jgi:hypothetical protein
VKFALLTSSATAFALGAALAAPLTAGAASSDHRTFDGTVVHVSSENIKVQGMEGGKSQILSFLINHGTLMRHTVKPNEYVRVTYDQKLLGVRHADSIDPWNNPALKIKS